MMKNNGKQLHILFFPFMAQGHTIPMLDIANLFASRGHRATIVTTPLNEPSIRRSVEKFNDRVSSEIATRVINFPTLEEAGLPEGCENMDFITSRNLCDELVPNFFRATTLLRPQLESLMEECKPDCLVADSFFPWSTAAAAEKFGIPRLIFNGMGFFAMSVLASLSASEKVCSDGEEFLVQGIPDRIFLTRRQLPEAEREEDEFLVGLFGEMKESESKSFGVIFNCFYELEPTYADYYRNQLGRRAWHIGPVSLGSSNRGSKNRGNDDQECLKWLDTKDPDSVIYICFGSMVNFGAAQLKEIAEGLESSGQHFIWVVRKNPGDPNEDWLPEGFEERTAGRGLIIRGWAPQVRILEHEAIGGFLTHCGWNSTLEAVSAGVPLVAWPVQAEQFLNEKLVTEVAKIGASVGVKEGAVYGGIVGREQIEKAVRRVMVGEEGEEMRRRVKELAAMAAQAVEEGGSSYSDFDDLIGEIQSESCCR
ncbi:unnamed protein product [Linum trigynum]|uniref:Glycosyltransferase n=1 Tax=Linum trigynum TaxID=586398 RepID=A0AAV2GJ18_9ROSI